MHRLYHQFLAWYHHKADVLGKKFGFDARYYISGNFWLMLQQGVAAVGGLAVTVVFARVLSPETFGAYKYILSLAGIAGVFSLTGMHTALTRAVARGEEGVFVPAVRAFALWTIPSALIMLAMSGYYGYMGNYTYMWALGIAAFLQPLWHTGMLYVPYLQGKKDFRTYTTYQIIETLVVSIMSIVAVLYNENIIILVAIFLLTHATFSMIILYKNTLKHFRKKNKISSVIHFAKHLSAMNAWSHISLHIDKIIIFQVLGPTNLAIYTLATVLPDHIRSILKTIEKIILPKFSKHKHIVETFSTYGEKLPYVFLFLFFLVITYIITAPTVYSVLFPNYKEAIIFTQIYSISFLATSGVIFTQTLNAHQKTKLLYVQQVSFGMISTMLMVVGSFFGSIAGVILAKVLSLIFATILSYTLVRYSVSKKI
jgi:O-antigen/teichoic acid export membrane protein